MKRTTYHIFARIALEAKAALNFEKRLTGARWYAVGGLFIECEELFNGLYRGLCGPRAQHSYDNPTKTKSHLNYSGSPTLLAADNHTDLGHQNSSFSLRPADSHVSR